MSVKPQSGQAVVEGLLVLGILSSLWLGTAWLGRLQDVALQTGHASRHRAFALAHQGQEPDALDVGVLLSQPWQTRRGEALLDANATRFSSVRDEHRPATLPGDPEPAAAAVRRDLSLGEGEVWVVAGYRRTTGLDQPESRLRDFDRLKLGISRYTSIMRGSGAAASDAATQARVARADSIWARQAGRSIELGLHVSGRVRDMDAAWGRPDFVTDWLMPWTAWVPAHHLSVGDAP